MSLASRINATFRRPTATVRIGGALWRDVISLSRSQSYGGGISAGEITGRNVPVNVVEGQTPIEWSWGYNDFEVTAFTGVVTRIVQQSYPNRVTLAVADPLWFADVRRSDIVTSPLNFILASTAVRQILGGAGVSRLSIPPLPASGAAWAGSEWTLGTLTPVRFNGSTALAAARTICEGRGYWLHADASGTARAILLQRAPTDAPFRTLRWGVDFLLAGPPERSRDAASVKNRVVVRGANTGVGGAQVLEIRQTGAEDRTFDYSNPLIEYVASAFAGDASAEAVALRLLQVWSRQPNIISIPRLKADPRLNVGMTVAVECAPIGINSPTPFFIYSLTTTFNVRQGEFVQNLTLDGGVGSGGYSPILPPLAAFSWAIVRETLDGVGVVEVFLDGSPSQSFNDGEIVSWSWSTATPTALGTPTTASGPQAMFAFPGATASASVTLTVTDTSGKVGTNTQTIDLVSDALSPTSTSVISLALGSAWAVSPDGGATWNNRALATVTAVPERGPLYANSGSTIYQTLDALATVPTATASVLSGTPAFLGATVGSTPTRLWAGVGSTVRRSIDGWATSVLWGTVPSGTVSAVLEDPAVANSVFVLAGNTLWQATTPTPGSAWVALFVGPAGATARHVVRGESGATTWISYTGTFTGSPLRRVEGPISALFPVLVPPVSEIRAHALSPDERTVYCWDQEGRGFTVDSATGIATANGADLAAGETAQHATHEDAVPIVYLATFGTAEGTTYKYFPLINALFPFYVPPAGQQAHRVGIGLPIVVTGTEVLLLTAGASPGGVWHWTQAAGWVLKNSGLPTGWTWRRGATNPFNPDDWLIIGDNGTTGRSGGIITSGGVSVLWRTLDSGVTWSPVGLADDGTPSDPFGLMTTNGAIGYASDGSMFVFNNYLSSSTTVTVAIWRGAGATLARTILTGRGDFRGCADAVAGQGGDIILTFRSRVDQPIGNGDAFGYIASGAGSWTVSGLGEPNAKITRVGTSRGAVLKLSSITRAIPDYRAGSVVNSTAISGGTVAGTAAEVLFIADRNAPSIRGVVRVPLPLTAPGTGFVVPESTGARTQAIATDPQTRTAVAVLLQPASTASPPEILATTDDSTWFQFVGPSALTYATTQAESIAVIVRS